jgi:hypothetical protein
VFTYTKSPAGTIFKEHRDDDGRVMFVEVETGTPKGPPLQTRHPANLKEMVARDPALKREYAACSALAANLVKTIAKAGLHAQPIVDGSVVHDGIVLWPDHGFLRYFVQSFLYPRAMILVSRFSPSEAALLAHPYGGYYLLFRPTDEIGSPIAWLGARYVREMNTGRIGAAFQWLDTPMTPDLTEKQTKSLAKVIVEYDREVARIDKTPDHKMTRTFIN